ncbi:MAG: carbohydrate-binding domain-containing protein [Bacteroidales bacterium]|nr:carbohydrate-binding domain-containing protein [Bacteroidales bacterium]
MKKILLLIALCVASVASMMGQTRVVRVHNNGVEVFSKATAEMDSIKISSNTALFNYSSNQQWSRIISGIDSITFATIDDSDDDIVDVNTDGGIFITWNNGSTVEVINPYADNGVDITLDGEDVTVNSTISTADLVYTLSGTSSNGSLSINSDNSLILNINNLSLTSQTTAAIAMLSNKKVVLNIADGTTNVLTDAASSSLKGAIQFKGEVDVQGSGSLTVNGNAKHGIQSSKLFTMRQGTVTVNSTAKDCLNVYGFVMNGGSMTTISTGSGDGIDGDEAYVCINGGSITVRCTSEDQKGLSCDSTMTINGGVITITVTGDQSKALKTKQDFYLNGGTLNVNASGSFVSEALDNGYDLSYCTGLKVSGNIYITGGTVNATCPSSNLAGKCLSADGDIYIMDGYLDLKALGASGEYTNSDGELDDYSSSCIKADGKIDISGGTIVANAYGKCINADGDINITDGRLCLTTTGDGACLPSTSRGTAALDGYVSKCINSDANITITGGTIRCESTGKGGRGIAADGNLTIGTVGASDDLVHIYVTTSGASVNYSGDSDIDYFKGIAKGIRIDGNITINSGTVSAYCTQSNDATEGIESKGAMYIYGGHIEAYAPDDAVNAGTYFEMNGGYLWCYSLNNDALDVNTNSGTYSYIHGGTLILIGGEEGLDMNTDHQGYYTIDGGNIIIKAGRMGFWDNPTQRSIGYVNISTLPTTGALRNAAGEDIFVINGTELSNAALTNTIASCNAKPGPGGPGGGGQGGPGGGNDRPGSGNGYYLLSPSLTAGQSYSLYSTGTISGGTSWHGVYENATFSTSSSATTVTAQ